MAVTITGKRLHESYSQKQNRVLIQYALSGTYVTGGFITPFLGVVGSPGTNQVSSKNPLFFSWLSPSGCLYVTTTTMVNCLPVCNTIIFASAGTQWANGTPVPDAAVPCFVDALRY